MTDKKKWFPVIHPADSGAFDLRQALLASEKSDLKQRVFARRRARPNTEHCIIAHRHHRGAHYGLTLRDAKWIVIKDWQVRP